jgi:hypothetical protein
MPLRIKPPFPLYVDEITPDKIKATTLRPASVLFNIRMLTKYGDMSMGELVNGIYLFPAGRYICMLVKSKHTKLVADNMVLLDLVERPDLAYEMGEKFAGMDLQRKFSASYTHILYHTETHERFTLVVGRLPTDIEVFPLKPRPPYES